VSADNIVVEGKINADIQTQNLHLKSSGIVEGEITYRNIIIDSGGLLKSDIVQNISSLNNLIRLNKS
jgi:cytoskeletal protein CcmA (bactofilin family)